MTFVFLLNLLCTLALAGIIWLVQVVVYPSFAGVGDAYARAYHSAHTRRIRWVVGPLMVVELVTAVALIFGGGLPYFPLWLRWLGGGLVLALWLSTAFWQVPAHDRLSGGFQAAALARLLRGNWLRVAGWSLRSLLLLWVLWVALAVG